MAANYNGAVALTQDSVGHCSLRAPSKCTAGHIKRYFQTGELPPANTTCEIDMQYFAPEEEFKSAMKLLGSYFKDDIHVAGGELGGHGFDSAGL